MSDTESFESVASSYDNCTWVGRECVKAAINSLKAAHDREIAQARDPQRLRGTKPDTFDGAIEALREFRWQHATNDEDAIPYINAVKEMHDREIRDTAQQEYSRGYHDGQHSMDAEHRAVAMRLRQLPLDGGSHENLSQIARAIWHNDFGWTQGACASLRDELVRLMGGVSDDTCDSQCCGACAACDGRDSGEHTEVSDGRVADDCGGDTGGSYRGVSVHLDGLTSYDVLWNERRKAIAELRKCSGGYTLEWDNIYEIFDALGVDYVGMAMAEVYENLRDRLVHLLCGDQPSGIDVLRAMDDGHSRTCPKSDEEMSENAPSVSITDELREFKGRINAGLAPEMVLALRAEINCIADRIDEQFDRICHQQEAVLQETIDSMCEKQDRLQERLRTAELGCDANHRLAEANAKWADDLLDLLRDAAKEYVDSNNVWDYALEVSENMRLEMKCNELLELLRDAAREYQDRHYWAQVWHDRAEDMRMEREELQAKLDAITAALNG